jgi:hypothetical protein
MPYSIVPLDIDRHRDALLALWADHTYDPKKNSAAMDRFTWLYGSPERSCTWIAIETSSHSVIGACSVFRANRCVDGRPVQAGVLNLFMIDAKHRTGAAALSLQRALTAGCHEAGFDLVLIKLSPHRMPVFIRGGFKRVGTVRKWRRWLDGDDAGSRLHLDSCRQEIISAADARFDHVFETTRLQGRIVGETSSAYLNWRYTGFRDNYRYYCLLHQDDGRLLGYVVYHRDNAGAIVADIGCESLCGPTIDELLGGFSEAMRKDGCAWTTVAYLGHSSFEDCLRGLGFEPMKSIKDRPLLAYADASLSTETLGCLFESGNWFFVGDQTTILLSESVWRSGTPIAETALQTDGIAS